MDLENALHGHVVAAIFEVLLVDAGYQVIPLGVERSVRELRAVGEEQYLRLIHPRLRSIPDFFVLDLDEEESWLTEVKYRPYLHPRLIEDLEAIQREWAPFTLILAVREPPDEWKGTIRNIRVFKIGSETGVDLQFLKGGGQRLQDVFAHLGARWKEATIERAQDAILRFTLKT